MKTLRAIYETRGPNPHELIRAVDADRPATQILRRLRGSG